MQPNEQPGPAPAEKVEEFAERREFVLRSVLRANRAMAVILAVVVLLGAVMVMLSLQARRNQTRAERAEEEATERLWKASVAQARAEGLSTQAGHRAAALEAVRAAAAIRPSLEVRNEAIAAMGLRDLVKEQEWALRPNAYGFNFDPDLEYYVVRYSQETLSLFRLADNSHVRDFPMPDSLPKGSNIGDFEFSATGKYVAIRYNGGAIAIYERDSGKLMHLIAPGPRIRNYSWPPSFTADDRTMCLTMLGPEGTLVLFDMESGVPRGIPGLPADVTYTGGGNRIFISPRGDLLAYFSGPDVRLIDAASGEVKHAVKGPSLVNVLSWDSLGQRISFTCDNNTLFVLEVSSGRVLQMGGKTILPWVQRFSPDGTLLVTSGTDGLSRLWDVASARLLSEVRDWRAVVFSRRGQRIAGGMPGQSVSVWRIEQPTATQFIQGKAVERATVWQSDLSVDGRWLVWSPPSWTKRYGFELLDLAQKNSSVFVATPGKVAAGLHPSKPQLWTAGSDGLTFHELPHNPPLDKAAIGKPAGTVQMPPGFSPWNASFSADGRYMAAAGTGGVVYVLDTETPGAFVKMEGNMKSDGDMPGPGSLTGSGALAISPDGRWVVGGRETDRAVPAVWDARTGKLVQRLDATYAHVAFSPDSRWLVTVGVRTGRLWAAGTWEKKWEKPRTSLLSNYGAAAFTADDSLMAWTQGVDVIELVEPDSGAVLAAINAASLNIVTGLHFSASGQKLFAGGAEGKLMITDMSGLRRNLTELGLDWPLAVAGPPTAAGGNAAGVWMPALFFLVPVGIAAILGILVLLRQSRLTREFVQATEVAARRTQELAAEREVGELKSRFVTTVSHEFRTPLGITMSAIELIRHYEDRLPPEEKRQLYDDIHSSTRNMAGLMEQVLVLGRVDAGKLAYRSAPLDLDALARKLTDESLSATNRKCPVTWTAENDLSGATGDEALLRHIFSNLLSNAVKYSQGGTPVNFTGRRESNSAVFSVQDRGIGIPEKDLPHLFEAFHRGANVGEIPGTGLGLVIIKRCVDLHGGTISVNTKQGEGTTFAVRLPMWGAA